MSAHRYPVRVYFEDTDAGGVVYHANYLRWAERARTESLRDMGLPHGLLVERHNLFLVVRRAEVEYLRPARLDEALIVETRVLRVGGASVELAQDVVDEAGAYRARLKVTLVCVSRDELRAARIPEPWSSALRDVVSPPAG
ncbi:Short-chain acyl-CoA hydrolase [Roseomonas mucosa]|jgi:acyl-CoA thioester hydrolase|uniref:Acyl-CoA thioester hydrolase YbgC n=1 Tax=Roseomonas mucosa TaxID=207340 RepID=A0A379N4G1_9PROT|nr:MULTISPECIES: tol-pal system-associated acyl-CoA thioesterase [Roseomonas]MBS5901646.1 tol-pal system-associated acyl-CoA thioesterase [Acetobacteraceae bacterium]MDT8261933.1 tol-pal system-associated acyl-CoA thioesterase [Roseomonas sp. DSM 102946]AWV23560.1 Short-chain acyl-CoA hydrolase [Roseomonas mucosa]MCG7353090.1 tol-pal system-associated acyl-CoA thioesterase [Roseomonas mucosa]MCG7358661.1 tol-pal system-associated acyl-CoA thioesterase [Roseomonas mucosa]